MRDLYKILGVSETADEATIKTAYRKLAREFHPDVTGGDKKKTERFKEINDAYGVLGDAKKRSEYDRLRHAPVGADGMPSGFDADSFAQVFGGMGGAGRGGAGGFDLGDLFSSLFGGSSNPFSRGGAGAKRGASRGADLNGTINLSFREAALGARKTIRVGDDDAIEVSVPGGVETGGQLRLRGKGAEGARGGPAGDLMLTVRVAADPHLRRVGNDVELDLPLGVDEALLGARVDVPTVENSVTVTIPPGTSSGAKLRLRGRGFKSTEGGRGDQICIVKIVVPKLADNDDEGRKAAELLRERLGARDEKVRSF